VGICSGSNEKRVNLGEVFLGLFDLQEEAVKTVLMQAELLCADWV
jgi:hypothetical protein